MDPEEKKKSFASQKARDLRDEMEDLRGLRKPRAATPKPQAAEFVAEHTVVAGDSLSAIASRYYGSATKEKWMLIYEANKELIGANPSLIRAGQVLKIPKLPE
jgi:nucleoid-associated protein YgaU